jgi:ATP-dependent DNA helicase RecG
MQTLCAFANGTGGCVVIGVKPNGALVGQHVSEQTLHDIAANRERFEPPLEIEVERLHLEGELSVLSLKVKGGTDSIPFAFDGRPYERVGNTTRKMPKERYDELLIERAHSRRRWENQVADEITIKDIDRDEVFRIARTTESSGRLTGRHSRT